MANPGIWEERWAEPLALIFERAGSLAEAKAVIDRSIDFARDGPRQYTITSPLSITTIAANLPDGNGLGGTIKVGSR